MSALFPPNRAAGLGALAQALAAEQRRDAAWETRLAAWEQPASDSEESQIERAARMVREAIAANAWLTGEGVTVEPQGSYFNNTNVRLEADMDLRVVHPSIRLRIDNTVQAANDHAAFNYTSIGRTSFDVAMDLRRHVGIALGAKFGRANVDDSGTKAFRVSAVPGSRADIDIVPALALDYITLCQGQTLLSPNYIGPVRGVAIFGTDGRETINFPHHHQRYGVDKRARTGHAFKKVVRQLKSLRDELVADGTLADGACASFFIECLAYRVEDDHYLVHEGRRARLRRILNRSWAQVNDPAWCNAAREINEHKMLFGDHQPWTPQTAKTFIALAIAELDAYVQFTKLDHHDRRRGQGGGSLPLRR